MVREQRFLNDLAAIVGSEHVLVDDEARRWASADALSAYRAFGRLPDPDRPAVLAVVRPAGTDEVAEVLRWAHRERVTVVPRGAGTGVMGGAQVVGPAVVLDLSRLDWIVVRDADMAIDAGAGATLGAVTRAAEAAGLLFAHDPWSRDIATVGGAVCTNGMGYLFGRYGAMGDQVLGLTAVTGDGRVFAVRPSVAGRPGPLLDKLLVGSEGTLAIVTEVVLRAWPLPEDRRFRTYRFASFAEGVQFVQRLFARGVVPAVLDLSDSGDELLSTTGAGAVLPSGLSEIDREISTLHVGFFGFKEEVEACLRRCGRLAVEFGADDLGEEPALAYWEERHATAERYAREVQGPRNWRLRYEGTGRFDYINVALPASRVVPYREAALRCLSTYSTVAAGETGLWCRPEIFSLVLHDLSPDGEGRATMERAVDDLLRLVHRFGGTMECIHGAGLKLAHLLPEEWGEGLAVMGRIRSALDPGGIFQR